MHALSRAATRAVKANQLRPCRLSRQPASRHALSSRHFASKTSPPDVLGPSASATTQLHAHEKPSQAQKVNGAEKSTSQAVGMEDQEAPARAQPPQGYQLGDDTGFPNLMEPDPVLDAADVTVFPARPADGVHHSFKFIDRSDIFVGAQEQVSSDTGVAKENLPTPASESEGGEDFGETRPSLFMSENQTPLVTTLVSRRVVQQTGKGKIARAYALVCMGNGDGLVGYGEGKDDDWGRALEKAKIEAARNMDRVERFERRTIFTEMRTKLGATQVILRPRPVGFGLRCNPNIHQILKAAGIKDASAKVWGSRNKINVIKATFRMLQAGHAPVAMGNGFGGSARRLDQGSGIRTKGDVERERGRKLLDLRT